MRALRWFSFFVLVAVACGDEAGPVTEIVVYVDADPAVRGRASNIQVRVSGSPGTDDFTLAAEGVVDVSPADLPLQFSFAPAGGDVTRLWEVIVGARASATEDPFNVKVARGNYIAGESRVLYMVLTNDCSDAEALGCSPLETCEAGACATSVRPAGGLPVYEGGRVPPPDVGPLCVDDLDCDDELFCNGGETCAPGTMGAGPRGCVPGDMPCMPMRCNEDTDSCVPDTCPDSDGDGWQSDTCGGNDCNDGESGINPDAMEIVGNGFDDDCDEAVDEGMTCPDVSEDTAGACMDGCDNDGDGDIDCEDRGCPAEPCYCAVTPGSEGSEATCMDGCDNDHNGFTDCTDFACRGTEACGFCGEPATIERDLDACTDGCDNDGNGFIDCEDWHCSGTGACPMDPCECATGEGCLARRAYGFGVGRAVCGQPCTVGSGIDVSDPRTWDEQGGCTRIGETCWSRGIPASREGVCAEGNPGPMPAPVPPNIGGRCSADQDCASPFGFGRCLDPAETGFDLGYCTVLDCAAPGVPMGSPNLCGPEGACVSFDNTSYCLETCTGSCRTGYRCVSIGDERVCLPGCPDGTCGMFGTCIGTGADAYCEPPSAF